MKILVTGGNGMVGSAIDVKPSNHQVIKVGTKDCDLRDRQNCFDLIGSQNFDAIIHLAARVGGVKGNSDMIAEFYSDNIRINTNVLDAATSNRVPRLISLLSTCVYPDSARHPLTPDQIHDGHPHESNFGYAYAKRMLDIQSKAIRKQYGLNYVTAIPNNMYGPNDNFDVVNGHVIPSMIRKIWEAKLQGSQAFLWGDGTQLREFTYSKDIAKILLFLLENYEEREPINIGQTVETSIEDLARMICRKVDFEFENVVWNSEGPRGQYRKPSDNSSLINLGWKEKYTDLCTGIDETIEWFTRNYPNVRGII